MDSPTAARTQVRGSRRLAFALAASLTCLTVAAPIAFAQGAPLAQDSAVNQLTVFEQATRVCAGRAEPAGTEAFLRTELYFGTNKPDGTVVTEAQFQYFLDHEITPRFPDGLTLLTGVGQFRGSSGVIERERSMMLILLYPVDAARSSGQKIQDIRTAYKRQFQQESVLRADEPRAECVSF